VGAIIEEEATCATTIPGFIRKTRDASDCPVIIGESRSDIHPDTSEPDESVLVKALPGLKVVRSAMWPKVTRRV
jgi:hypothetical protein